ncbi:MAG: succinylglutamate desuccinylase/aspartoacylase family protein [Parcubacteria group bacterium]|jgi:succinylglutamate desuccinylase
MENKKILFVTATHGDEQVGVDVIGELKKNKLRKKFSTIIANPKALKKKVRFIEADLNRVFPGNAKGNYEERRARVLLKKIQKYDCVVDLHGTVSRTGIFIIITRLNLKNLKLALRFDIKKIVIWPDAGETNGSLVTFVKSGIGIEIESGKKSDVGIKKELKKVLKDFLNSEDKPSNFNDEMKGREFFTVIGKIKAKNKTGIKLQDWKKVKGFYPVFVGQYPGIACYKLKKIKPERVLVKLT